MENHNPWRRIIKKHWVLLITDLQPKKLLSHLRAGPFDQDDVDLVRAEKTERAQAEKLLEILPKKDAHEQFFTAVEKTQPHLAKLLNDELVHEEKERDTRNLLKQARSHSADLQEKIDALERENLDLRAKVGKQATKPSKDTIDILLSHLASLTRSSEQVLSLTKQTHKEGERTNQDCSVCKDAEQSTGKILGKEIRQTLQDAHRIHNQLSTMKNIIKVQEQKVAAALKKEEDYRITHTGKIKKLKEECNKLKKQLQEKNRIKEETFEEKRKLEVRLDELEHLNDKLKEENQKYRGKLKETQKLCDSPKKREERTFSKESFDNAQLGSKVEVRLKELCTDNKILADKHETLANKYKTLVDKHEALTDKFETLADEHKALADKHETLAGEQKTWAGEHKALAGENKALKKLVEILERGGKATNSGVNKKKMTPRVTQTEQSKSAVNCKEINSASKKQMDNGRMSFMETGHQKESSTVQDRQLTTQRTVKNPSKYSIVLENFKNGEQSRIYSLQVVRCIENLKTERTGHRSRRDGNQQQTSLSRFPSLLTQG